MATGDVDHTGEAGHGTGPGGSPGTVADLPKVVPARRTNGAVRHQRERVFASGCDIDRSRDVVHRGGRRVGGRCAVPELSEGVVPPRERSAWAGRERGSDRHRARHHDRKRTDDRDLVPLHAYPLILHVDGSPSFGPLAGWSSGHPAALSTITSSKFAVHVLAAVSPIWIRPTGVVPVFAAHAFTIREPLR